MVFRLGMRRKMYIDIISGCTISSVPLQLITGQLINVVNTWRLFGLESPVQHSCKISYYKQSGLPLLY